MQNPALWERLTAFNFDGGENGEAVTFSFSARLARENGWELEFAQRVLEEYRRFLYLACEAGHPVTPSDEVDQAWHLHLTYSRSYWEKLCPKVLERPLHHEPTRGGKAEGDKFENWYEETKTSYQSAFGEVPPMDIWPASEIRFSRKRRFRRIDTESVWLLPKPALLSGRRLNFNRENLKVAPILILAILLAGCAAVQSDMQAEGLNVFNWHGEGFLAFFWALSAFGIVFSLWMRSQARRPLDAVFPIDPLDAYELARLKDGKNLAVDVAVASLYEKGAIDVMSDGKLQRKPVSVTLKGLGKSVWDIIGNETTVLSLRQGVHQDVVQIERKLTGLGLLLEPRDKLAMNMWPLGITSALIFLGIIKIVIGLFRDRPVGFLILSCLVLAVIFFWFCSNTTRRSLRGEMFLKNQQAQYRFLPRETSFNDPDMRAIYFALAGFAVFPLPIQSAMRPPSSGSDGGGSGCSSSNGGSDGGSSGCGGGGCGGCGGGGD